MERIQLPVFAGKINISIAEHGGTLRVEVEYTDLSHREANEVRRFCERARAAKVFTCIMPDPGELRFYSMDNDGNLSRLPVYGAFTLVQHRNPQRI